MLGRKGEKGGWVIFKKNPTGGVVRVKFPMKMLSPLLLVESQDQFSDWLKDRYTVYTQLVAWYICSSLLVTTVLAVDLIDIISIVIPGFQAVNFIDT